MKQCSLISFFSVLSMLSSPALLANSSDDYFDMDLEQLLEVTITSATGTEQTLAQAPSIATVITAKQIERSSARTLDEVLAMVPGLKVYLSSSNVQKNSYDIRGLHHSFNSQILMLINGVSIDIPTNGTPLARMRLPISAIKQVEVIRGPGSAVYGADAFAGVINIITKDADYLKHHSEVGARYGTNEALEVFANYGTKYSSGMKLGLNLSYASSEVDDTRQVGSDLQSSLDAIFATDASLAPGQYNDDYEIANLNLELAYKGLSLNVWGHNIEDAGTGSGGAGALDPQGQLLGHHVLVDLDYELELADKFFWNNKLIYSHSEIDNRFVLLPAGTTLPIGDDGNAFTSGGGIVTFSEGLVGKPSGVNEKFGFETTFNINSFNSHEIRLSLGYSRNETETKEQKNFGPGVLNGTEGVVDGSLVDVTGTENVYFSGAVQKILFASAQDIWSVSDAWQLTSGLRYDHYSDFGDTFNPRVALVWNANPHFSSKLLYGRAFRAPISTELYFINNPINIGNPELDPEVIDTLELAFNFAPNLSFNSRLNFYLYEAHDLITTQAEGATLVYQNAETQRGAGTELELHYQVLDSLLLSADYAYRWTENSETEQPVADVPKHVAHAMADWHFAQGWYLNTDMLLVADTPRAQGDAREEIDDYAILNAALRYQVHRAVDLSLGVRNITDKAYVDPSVANPVGDYPMPGRSYFAELKYLF